jgi:hypothetical protein
LTRIFVRRRQQQLCGKDWGQPPPWMEAREGIPLPVGDRLTTGRGLIGSLFRPPILFLARAKSSLPPAQQQPALTRPPHKPSLLPSVAQCRDRGSRIGLNFWVEEGG